MVKFNNINLINTIVVVDVFLFFYRAIKNLIFLYSLVFFYLTWFLRDILKLDFTYGINNS